MKALVIGLGKSGRGAAKLLLKQGWEVVGVDRAPEPVEGITVLPETATIGPVDLVVLSPGIPRSHPLAKGNVIGEAELAFRTLKNRAIGITGTNGKTTLTLLLTHILNGVGIKARALGNVGNSLAEYACNPDPDEFLVVELSSFQLETMTTPCLELSVITNITPDHLDRYSSFEEYANTKKRIKDLADSYLQLTGRERYWGETAWLVCERLGIAREDFDQALKSFKSPPHRMEFVGEIEGVRFVNDSKGTNPEATLYAIENNPGKVLLIAGGQSKQGTFANWKKEFLGKVKEVFAIGETASQIEKEVGGVVPVKRCLNLEEAVAVAKEKATQGETVLLSPGCASFDQFRNYEERGERFKSYVGEVRR